MPEVRRLLRGLGGSAGYTKIGIGAGIGASRKAGYESTLTLRHFAAMAFSMLSFPYRPVNVHDIG